MAPGKKISPPVERDDSLVREGDTRRELSDILESISDAFFAVDREWRFTYVNRKAEELWSRSREDLIGKNLWEEFPQAAGSEQYQEIRRAMEERTTTSFEAISPIVGVWVAGRVYPSANGGVSVYFDDVTERKRAEEALRESEERLRAALHAGRMATWDWDPATDRVTASDTMDDLFGLMPGETFQSSTQGFRLVHPDDVDRHRALIEGASERGESWHSEFRIIRPRDGAVAWLEERATAKRDPQTGMVYMTGIVWDITERKLAEEALGASEERLQRAIAIETVGVIFFRADGQITEANDAFLRMSGYGREDLAGGLLRWDVMTPPEWMPRSLEAVEELRTTGRTTPYEKEYIRKDGSRWWGLFAATRLAEEEAVEFVIDVTGRKRAEEERERLVAHELRARAQAEERRRLSRELHDRVAHDIALVHQSLELYDVHKEGSPDKAAAKIEVAKETVKRAFNATRNLSMELRQREVQRSLEAALSDLMHDLVPPGVAFDLSVDGDEAPVPAEVRSQVFLILREAIRNAVTHSGCRRITVRSEILPEEITGCVEDDGRGFGARTLRPAHRNGLRSMEERAALLGGTLEVSSAPGRGTKVRVTIPLEERDGG